MKKVINYIPVATFDEALSKSAEISGRDFYSGYENCYEPHRFTPEYLNNDRGFFVCQETGDVYYIYKNVSKDGRYGAGEEILNKLELHTALSAGGFNSVVIMNHIEGFEAVFKNEIIIVQRDWDRCQQNRKHFAEIGQIVTTL